MLDPIVQNQALHTCLGAFPTSPVTSLHVQANEIGIFCVSIIYFAARHFTFTYYFCYEVIKLLGCGGVQLNVQSAHICQSYH